MQQFQDVLKMEMLKQRKEDIIKSDVENCEFKKLMLSGIGRRLDEGYRQIERWGVK